MMKKFKIALGLSSKTIPQIIDQARVIVLAMTNNKELFPEPTPSLKAVMLAAEELQTTYLNSRDAGKEFTALMRSAVFKLEIELIDLANYVLSIANRNNDKGYAIIYGAGMEVKNQRNGNSRIFNVSNTLVDGRVKLQTKGAGNAAYVWQYSLDEENWNNGSVSTKATTFINGLEQGNRYYFRVAVVKAKQGPWLGPIQLIVT